MKKKITQVIVGLMALCCVVMNPVKGQWSELGGAGVSIFNGSINHLISDKSGNLYAAGGFTNGNGKFYVAKWNGNTWSELGGTNVSKFNGSIRCMTIDASGNLYTVGNFKNDSGRLYVAKWNGSSWSEVVGSNALTLNNISWIFCLTTDASGNLYAAGRLTNGNGKNYVAKWDGNAWSEVGGTNASTFNDWIGTLTFDANGNLYGAGYFTNDNGMRYVAKWNGTTWSEVGGNNNSTFNDAFYILTTDASGNLYAGGDFKNSSLSQYVAKWDGNTWSEVGSGKNAFPFNGSISSILLDTLGHLYASGNLYDGSNNYVSNWNGNVWSSVGGWGLSPFNGTISSMVKNSSGDLIVAGYFMNSSNKNYVAKYGNTTTPVTLTTFTARTTETNQIKTTWQTTNEVNASHFIVEQSKDGKTFTPKGSVKAVGTGANSYAFDVPYFLNPPSGDGGGDGGLTFFRLKMIDKDGSFEYSKVVSVSLTTNHSPLISIKPNPAKASFTLQLGAEQSEKAVLYIINSAGQIVQQQSITLKAGQNQLTIAINTLAKGSYQVLVKSAKKQWQQPLIKE